MELTKKQINEALCKMENLFDDLKVKAPEHKQELSRLSALVRGGFEVIKNRLMDGVDGE